MVGQRLEATDRPVRWQRFFHVNAPTLAVVPVFLIALCFYFGSTIWSVVMSFTASKIFPDMTFVGLHKLQRGHPNSENREDLFVIVNEKANRPNREASDLGSRRRNDARGEDRKSHARASSRE